MTERGGHEAGVLMSGKRPLDHCRSGYSKTTEARMCEAYVTLGRLSHVKMRHEEDTEKLRAVLEERVGGAFKSALEKVRGDYEALKDNLEKLFLKSIDDLEAHKLAVEAPTRARVELIEGQKTTAARVEADLKALIANPDEDTVLRELPEATRNVGRVLKSSVKLVGLHFPEISALTAADFPLGRLHNVVIAPKRSGDRGRKQPLSPPKAQQTKTNTSKAVPGAGAGEATATAPGGGQDCCRDNRRAPGWSERVPPTATPTPTPTSPPSQQQQQQQQQQSSPRSRPTGALGGEGDEPVPCAAEGAAAKACDRCACACQAGDVWVAYRTLRKRYHALKDQADVEEVRVKVEDRRRELQAEFDTRRGEMEMELEQKRRELMESGQRLARARVELEEKRKELLESSHGLSEAEVQSLRGIVQASLKECQKVQQESAELREKVLVGQQCLERALQDALSAREEIARRKHHGQILLARIRYLKGMTSACVNNTTARKLDRNGADHGGGGGSSRLSGAVGDGGSDGGDGEGEATTNSFSSSSSTFESEDEPDESDHNNGDADNGDNVISNDNASDSDVGRTAGSTSDEDSDVIGSAPAPPPPAYNDVSAFFDDSEADDDDDATISVRVRRGWTEASNLDEATAGREGADGRPKSWFLEKERENLTREINRLSAELAAAGVSGLDDDESRLSDLDDSRPDIAAPIPPPPPPPPVAARSSKHSKKEPRGGGIPAPRRHANINPVADNNINSSSSSHRNEGSSSNHNSNSNSNSNNHHANGYNGGDGGGGSGDRGGGGGSYGSYGMRPAFPDGAQRRRRRFDHRPGGGGEPHRSGVEPARATGGFERPAKSGRAPPPLPLLPQHRHPQHPPSSSSAYPNHPGAYPGNHLGTYPEAYLGSYPGYRGSGFPDEDDDGGGVTGSDMSLSPRSSRRGNGRGNSRGIRYRRG